MSPLPNIIYKPLESEISKTTKSKKQFASRLKRSPPLDPRSYMDYISTLLHLLCEQDFGLAALLKDHIVHPR